MEGSDYCEHVVNFKSELEEHVLKEHFEEMSELTRKFHEHKSESIGLLERVPECELILTPGYFTNFRVD